MFIEYENKLPKLTTRVRFPSPAPSSLSASKNLTIENNTTPNFR